ncbi:hypothetical protein Taro_006717, partial [Colocasia esculenta]|nr:hypothetical protein [Colocasia esculenta]
LSALYVYIYEAITLVAITFVSTLVVWVRRQHPARRYQGSDAGYVAISVAIWKATGPSSLSEGKRQVLCRDLGRDIILVAFFLKG